MGFGKGDWKGTLYVSISYFVHHRESKHGGGLENF
jgi:hypothetical protein